MAVVMTEAGEPYRGKPERPRVSEQVSAVAVSSVTAVAVSNKLNFVITAVAVSSGAICRVVERSK